MNYLKFIFIFTLFANNLFANNKYNLTVDSIQVLGQIIALEKFDKYTVVLAFGNGMIQQKSKYFYNANLNIFNGEKWQNISNFVNYNGVSIPIAINFQSRIAFDSLGNIWIAGAYLYKYSDNRWTIFNFEDVDEITRFYEDICVDIKNNIWITSKLQIYDTLKMTYKNISSELIKINNDKYEKVYSNIDAFALTPITNDTYGSTLTALSNGDVVVCVNSSQTNKVLFFNTSGLYDSLFVEVNDDTIVGNYRNEKRNISQINMIENELYFALNLIEYYNSIDMVDKVCCSGLSAYSNNKWRFFDENNNLQKYGSFNTFLPVHRIYKFHNKIIAIINTKIYLLENNKFYEIKWENLLKNSILIPSHIEYKKSIYLNDFIDRLINSYKNHDIQLSDIVENNNKLWIQSLAGIFVVDISLITKVDELQNLKTDLYIYPNISNEYFEFYNTEPNSKYKIYNMMGTLMSSGSTSEKKVETLNLQIGTYIVEIVSENNVQIFKIIKNK